MVKQYFILRWLKVVLCAIISINPSFEGHLEVIVTVKIIFHSQKTHLEIWLRVEREVFNVLLWWLDPAEKLWFEIQFRHDATILNVWPKSWPHDFRNWVKKACGCVKQSRLEKERWFNSMQQICKCRIFDLLDGVKVCSDHLHLPYRSLEAGTPLIIFHTDVDIYGGRCVPILVVRIEIWVGFLEKRPFPWILSVVETLIKEHQLWLLINRSEYNQIPLVQAHELWIYVQLKHSWGRSWHAIHLFCPLENASELVWDVDHHHILLDLPRKFLEHHPRQKSKLFRDRQRLILWNVFKFKSRSLR